MNLYDYNPPYDPVPEVSREDLIRWDSEAEVPPGIYNSYNMYGVCLLPELDEDFLRGVDIDEFLNVF